MYTSQTQKISKSPIPVNIVLYTLTLEKIDLTIYRTAKILSANGLHWRQYGGFVAGPARR